MVSKTLGWERFVTFVYYLELLNFYGRVTEEIRELGRFEAATDLSIGTSPLHDSIQKSLWDSIPISTFKDNYSHELTYMKDLIDKFILKLDSNKEPTDFIRSNFSKLGGEKLVSFLCE